MFLFPNYTRYSVYVPDGYFTFIEPQTSNWVHAVMNFIGSNEGQGIRIYNDDKLIGNDTTKSNGSFAPSNGGIQLGRIDFRWLNNPGSTYPLYASVEVDELLIFNRTLTEIEIILLKQTLF